MPAIDYDNTLTPIELARQRFVAQMGKDAPNAVSTVSHFIVMVAHRRYYCTSTRMYRPTRRPGSPSRPVSTSGFLQLAQVHAAHAILNKTSHRIIGSALQYAHAPQIALPDASVSPRLGCCAE